MDSKCHKLRNNLAVWKKPDYSENDTIIVINVLHELTLACDVSRIPADAAILLSQNFTAGHEFSLTKSRDILSLDDVYMHNDAIE